MMIVIVALDDNNGMMFNKRRQSKDRVLREDIINVVNGSVLWMNNYSAKQFEEGLPDNVIVDDDFLNKAGAGEYCFVEDNCLKDYEDKVETIICYKWNRVYPADLHFEIQLNNWTIIDTVDFEGSSHKEITKETWHNER